MKAVDLAIHVAAACVLLLTGCTTSAPSIVLSVDQSQSPSISVSERGPVIFAGQAQPTLVSLSGAMNEVLSFRFKLSASVVALEQPALASGAFRLIKAEPGISVPLDTATSPRPQLRLFRMRPLRVTNLPGWYLKQTPPDQRELNPLDVLVPIDAPRGAMPARLLTGETYEFWADLHIPLGCAPGVHEGRIELRTHGRVMAVLSVHLTVWPFVLPDKADVVMLADVNHQSLFRQHFDGGSAPPAEIAEDWSVLPNAPQLDHLLRFALRMLREHRLTPLLSRLSPTVRADASGGPTIDWSHYDSIATQCLSGDMYLDRAPQPLWTIPTRHMLDSLQAREGLVSPYTKRLLAGYIAQVAAHFADKGWLDRSVLLLPPCQAGSSTPPAIDTTLDEIVKGLDQRPRILSRRWPQDMKPFGWQGDQPKVDPENVDGWMPSAQFYDPASMKSQRLAGRETWVAVDRPPFSGSTSVLADASTTRVLSWQARQLDASVMDLGCVNDWPPQTVPATPDDCVAYRDAPLLYPGRPFGLDHPVPSVRLKLLRASQQDAAYRGLLQKRHMEYIASSLIRSLAPYAGTDAYRTHFQDGRANGWASDASLFDTARLIMADSILHASTTASDVADDHPLERTTLWRRMMTDTRRIRLLFEGARVRLTGKRSAWEAVLNADVSIVNRSRSLINGQFVLDELPSGWSPLDDPIQTPSIPPNTTRRVSFEMRATHPPAARSGVSFIPAALSLSATERYDVALRIAYLTAVPYHGTVRIDGRLDDWPAGEVNVASNFQLISGPSDDDRMERTVSTGADTHGFVMRDDTHLYIALNCALNRPLSNPHNSHNRVTYDDLIPRGGELVELLFDPGNAGTRTPDDLYHILIKPSGAYLVERGIGTTPPCSARRTWAVDLELATSVHDDRWIAELKVPISALTDGDAHHTIWGFNITRFEECDDSFRTWSGATRNAYDPLTLGNLYLP